MACHGQMRQELLDLLHAHVARMPFAVKEDEAFDPAQVSFFGAYALVPDTNCLTDLLQKLGRLMLAARAMTLDHRALLSGTVGNTCRIYYTYVHYNKNFSWRKE